MQSVYSVYGTALHLILEDEFANNYNVAIRELSKAQKRYTEKTGKNWTGLESLEVNWTEENQAAFNKFADLMNLLVEVNGGTLDLGVDEFPSEYLEKV